MKYGSPQEILSNCDRNLSQSIGASDCFIHRVLDLETVHFAVPANEWINGKVQQDAQRHAAYVFREAPPRFRPVPPLRDIRLQQFLVERTLPCIHDNSETIQRAEFC